MDVVGAGTEGVFVAGAVSGRPAMWYSTDGTDWQRVAGAEKVIGDTPGTRVSALLVTPNGVYATGTVQDGTNTAAALWTSSDGITWHNMSAPFVGPGDHVIDGLVANSAASTPEALVAVGAVRSGPTWTPATWISPDGQTWSQADEALPSAPRPQTEAGGSVVRAVAATTSGVEAVGGSSNAARLWTSPDGNGWNEVALPTAAADATNWTADLLATDGATTVIADSEAGQPHVLVEGPSGWDDVTATSSVFGAPRATATPAALLRHAGKLLLVVDVSQPGRALDTSSATVDVLGSADGRTWTSLSSGGPFTGSTVNAVTVSSGTLVAVGSKRPTSGSGPSTATMWTSTDGRTWTSVATFGITPGSPQTATAVAALGTQVVAAGRGTRSAGATSATTESTALGWSASGSGWQATGPLDAVASIGTERPLAACSNGKKLVAVGSTTRTGIPPAPPGTKTKTSTSSTATTVAPVGSPAGTDAQADDGTMAASWSTTNGVTWTVGHVSPPTGVGADVKMVGCVATAKGFVAYGQAPGHSGEEVPALWTSSNGSAWTLVVASSLDDAGPAPFTDLATHDSTWLAVSGGSTPADGNPDDPTVALGNPILAPQDPAAATGIDGSAGVWLSSDNGTSWSQLPTTGTPWASAPALTTDRVLFDGADPVVAGQVEGQLAVWSGRPRPVTSG
jgi:hypothetical protein